MIDDSELLHRYARERSESAFAELVQRKAALVYSAALRQVGGDTALAQDVSQGVFIDLARKANQLAGRPVLTSWLYTSTRFAALKARRGQQRRLAREHEAHTMQETEQGAMSDADWEKLRPFLDAEICELTETDRDAVLMRYFEGQPFAAMGAKLGIGESSARMRADRALDKLRAGLLRKGITSTAAMLGLALSTKTVVAAPAGLAAVLASGALAQSAVVGGSAGLLVKLYSLSTLNKLQSGALAAIAVTTAGFASREGAEEAANTVFFAFTVCFGVGLLFALLSAIGVHAFGGHGEVGHDSHLGHDGHAEAGSGSHDMPGFEPLSPTTIATFITAFGGFGMIFGQINATRSPWISVPLAALGGLAIAVVVFWLFRAIFRHTQASSEGRVAELVGAAAIVITPIPAGSVGEIAYVQAGTRYSAPARTDDGLSVPGGSTVKITRIVGSQFYVAAR